LALAVCAATGAQGAWAEDLAAIRSACAGDAQTLCAGVQQGGGRIAACLKAHKDQLSDACRHAAGLPANPPRVIAPGAASGTTSPTPASATAAPAASHAPADAPAPAAAKAPYDAGAVSKAPPAAGTAHGSYLRMKQVQIIAPMVDPKLGNGKDP